MIRTTQRTLMTFAAIATCAVAAPAAFAVDMRSPDSKERAIATQPQPASSGSVDLRSPDAKDAGRQPGHAYVDLRSPDAKDAGRPAPKPAPVASTGSDGFEWGYPAAGAAVGAALLLLGMTLTRRRSRNVRKERLPAVTS
jgi:hypothetical protein